MKTIVSFILLLVVFYARNKANLKFVAYEAGESTSYFLYRFISGQNELYQKILRNYKAYIGLPTLTSWYDLTRFEELLFKYLCNKLYTKLGNCYNYDRYGQLVKEFHSGDQEQPR